MQYLEVYQNVVTDLLTGRVVRVMGHEESVVMLGCREVGVSTPNEAFELLRIGEARKRRGNSCLCC